MENKTRKIPIQAQNVWRIHALILYSTILLIILGVSLLLSLTAIIVYIMIICLLLLFLLEYFTWIVLRQQNFNYRINDEFIEINSGRFYCKKIIIPIHKVAYIKQKEGPIIRNYNLVNLELGTLVNSFEIPCLTEQMFLDIQNEITSNPNYSNT